MSRILRRPMFRGGRVSSYGTGIASGLADGGRVGYYIDQKGGIVTGGDIMSINRNQALKLAELYGPSSIDSNLYNVNSLEPYIPPKLKDISIETEVEDPLGERSFIEGAGEKDISFDLGLVETPEETDKRLAKERSAGEGSEGEISTTSVEDSAAVAEEKPGEEIQVIPGIGDDDPTVVEESDLASMVSKYEDLLGGKKAWKRDATKMLMSIGSEWLKPGATIKSGASEFLAKEAAKGPGRAEKIKQTATMLAIKGEQAKDAAKTSMETAVALKLVGITDKNKERAFTTRVADYTKEFMKDPYNPFKQKNAGSFANALVMSENLGKEGQFVGVMDYDADGEAKPEAGIIYIDALAIVKGTPFYFNDNFYKTHKEALEAQQGG